MISSFMLSSAAQSETFWTRWYSSGIEIVSRPSRSNERPLDTPSTVGSSGAGGSEKHSAFSSTGEGGALAISA